MAQSERRYHLSVTIRRLTTSDIPLAVAAAARFKSSTISTGLAGRFLANPANYLIVAQCREDLVGFLVAYRLQRLDRAAEQLFIYELEVVPSFRRRRVGTQLIGYVRRLVQEEALMEAFVLTDHSNEAAVGLYTRTGARIEGEAGVLFVYPGHAA